MSADVLLLATRGRDAEVIAQILKRQSVASTQCRNVAALAANLSDASYAVVVTEESLEETRGSGLSEWLEQQPAWSDLPFVLLATKRIGTRPKDAAEVLEKLGNVIVLERPLHSDTLIRAIHSAVRGRHRQWEARRHLLDLQDAEGRLIELNQSLERLVADRTSELSRANDRLVKEIAERERAQRALVQSQKMEAVGQLTGGIAHDFNNLLTVIGGNLDMIHRSTADERTKVQAAYALQAAERAGKLTQQLLIFSRSQKLTLEPLDINELIGGMSDLLERTIGADASIELDLDTRAPWTRGDKNQLELAVLNLAINARDAMVEGGKIVISTAIREKESLDTENKNFAVISVRDTGPGVPAHLLEKVFEPFFTTKVVGKGTGLGLSQVYGIAVQSGGSAQLDNIPNSGADVSIWLPLTTAEKHSDNRDSPVIHLQAGAKRNILVAEDDPAVRQFIVDSLESAGFQVRGAADGMEALAMLARERPDLLLVDFAMPGINGADVVRNAWDIHAGLPVVMATGYADMKAVEKILPPERVLRKPFLGADLVRAVVSAVADNDSKVMDQV